MEYLIGIILALLGWLFYERTKRQSAEGILDNQESKGKILDLEAKRKELDAMKLLEELKQELIKKQAEDKKNEPVDPKDFD